MNIEEELKKLPDKPGVYIMKDKSDQIIYIGKAINLKNRVRSYFRESNTQPKVVSMVKNIEEFEYIVTDSELEALILECNLIKEHRPRYNILLKDDKSYPYIVVTVGENFPRVMMVHRQQKDKHKYFGPYTSRGAVKETLELIHGIWNLRRCNKKFPRDFNKERPCLNYHIGQCSAPCLGTIDEEAYNSTISKIIDLLNGKHELIIKELEAKMIELSENMEFEKAAEIRDKIAALKKLSEKQKIDYDSHADQDVIAFAKADDEALFQVFFIRGGKMIGREHFMVTGVDKLDRAECITGFIKQFYNEVAFIPKEIIIEDEINDKEIITKWLCLLKNQNVTLNVPKKGDKLKLIDLAHKNAILTLEQFGENIKREKAKTLGAIKEIEVLIGEELKIERIEAYDVSNIQGYESVASMIVFEGGKPKRNDYRKFKIKGVLGPNDYASMQEVITRRFLRYKKEIEENTENAKFSLLPDLILIDGGKGHISAAKSALEYLGIEIVVCGMVKDDRHRTRGLIYNDKEIIMDTHSEGFKLLTRIQDEVHRFAIEYHRKLREKIMIKSDLDEINGIGEKRKRELLKHFGDIELIKKASIEELTVVKSMDKKSAEALYNFFRTKKLKSSILDSELDQ